MLTGGVVLLSLAGMLWCLTVDYIPLGARVFGIAICAIPGYFLGRLAISYLRRLAQSKPDIAIDADGLMIASYADKAIAWDNIAKVQRRPIGYGQCLLMLELLDVTQDPPRKRVTGLIRWARRKNDFGDVIFATEGMNVSDDDVQRAIASHLPWLKPS